MLNGVGEVLDRAGRCLLLWWVLGGRIGLREVRDDDLGVALGAEGAGLKQGLPVENATLVHVETLDSVSPACQIEDPYDTYEP